MSAQVCATACLFIAIAAGLSAIGQVYCNQIRWSE
jgi:hypothetical protein